MAVISVKDVVLRFGDEALFDGITLHIEEGDRLCLLGRNGTGKSTLLKLMAGLLEPDSGLVARSRDRVIGLLGQEIDEGFTGTCLEFCLSSAGGPGQRKEPGSPSGISPGSEVESRRFLTQLGVDPEAEYRTLSGGGRRRAMTARILAKKPDILLLDEPTNHLDINSVLWLEEYLRKQVPTLILITHDRAFAKTVATRVAEIDRGQLFSFNCGYDEFLSRKQALLETEEQQRAKFDKRLAAEEAWLRRGVKARRTRDEGRVRALIAMRERYRLRRNRIGQVSMKAQEAEVSGDLVAELTAVSFAYSEQGSGETPVIENLSTTIMRGDRVGIVGPNGCGKTTLIQLILGKLKPDTGSIRLGTNLRPLYFDQMRSLIDPEKTLLENLSGGDDSVVVGGRSRHINAYLQDFLFDPDRAKSPVNILSGGEQNRLMLAKLFTQPSNLLVLDEPTNDLDMETLDLLEDLLSDYQGTILLVSHDREFLDNIVTDCLVFTPDSTVEEYVGGYSDWRAQYKADDPGENAARTKEKKSPGDTRPRDRKTKRSYKEQQELASLPETIAALEQEIHQLHQVMADPEFYRREGDEVAQATARLETLQADLERRYDRWQFLEERGGD